MRKTIIYLIIISAFAAFVTAVILKTNVYADEESSAYEYLNIEGKAREDIDVEFLYSDSMLLGDAQEFSTDLVKASVCLAGAGYEEENIKPIIEKMNYICDGCYQYDKTLTLEDNDHVAYTIAHRDVVGTNYRIYLVVVRGTTGNEEWFSNFNLGLNNGGNHKGFYTAAAEVKDTLYPLFDKEKDNILWVTGHSRGAAIANIIAGECTAGYPGPSHVFGYTFACPNVSTHADTSYNNIYNLNNKGDLIAAIPPSDSNWSVDDTGYHRYGKDISWDYSEDLSAMEEMYVEATGSTYTGASDNLGYITTLKMIVPKEEYYYNQAPHFALMAVAYIMMDEEHSNTSFSDFVLKYGKGIASELVFNKLLSCNNYIDIRIELNSISDEMTEAIDLIEQLLSDTENYTPEEFAVYISEHPDDILRIKNLTGVTVDTGIAAQTARNLAIQCLTDADGLWGPFKHIFDLLDSTGKHILNAIECAHRDETYVLAMAHAYYGYKGYAGVTADTVVLPDNITSIGPGCFENASINTITFPDNLKCIGDRAFYDCSALVPSGFPETIVSIGESAFYKCSSIINVTLSNSLIYLEDSAFYGCTGIKELTLPIDCSKPTCFKGCNNIEKIHYLKGQSGIMPDRDLSLANHYTATGEYSSKDVLGEVDFEEGVTHIGSYAFYGGSLIKCAFPSSLKSIGDYAFCKQSKLKQEIYFNDGFESLGAYCFYEAGITSLKLPEGVKRIPWYCFYKCRSLTVVELPETLTDIGDVAFAYDEGITELTMPVECRKGTAFYQCYNIETIHYLKGNTGIMPDWPQGDYDEVTNDVINYFSCESLKSVDFEEGVIHIGSYALYSAFELTSLSLPTTLKSIGEYAFAYSKSWDAEIGLEIILPDGFEELEAYSFYHSGITYLKISDGVTIIPEHCFDNCRCLETVILPDSISIIGDRAFYDCLEVTSINMPKNLDIIGENAFYHLYQLEGSLNLSATNIGEGAFSSCNSITEVVLADGLNVIPSSVFSSCSALKKISIPSSVTNIGENAFRYCQTLWLVDFYGTSEEWNAITINNGNDSLTSSFIHYMNDTAAIDYSYTGHDYDRTAWITGYNGDDSEISIPENICGYDVVGISPSAFSGATILKSVEIPSGVVNIGERAFYGCSNLNSVILPSSLTAIQSYTFADCTSLVDVSIPETVSMICFYAFNNCASLENITIPKTVTSIETAAFDPEQNLTIHGYHNSEAERYAIEENIPFVAIDDEEHEMIKVSAKPASCIKPGNIEHWKCTKCGKFFADESGNHELSESDLIIPATGHSPAEAVHENEVAPACQHEGSYDVVVYCSVCHEELSRDTETIAKISHNPVTIPAVPVTCTAPGFTEGEKCSVCGEILTTPKEIPALGHDYQDGVCTRCGDELHTDGWVQDENGIWYYFTDGVAATGWKKVGSTWYLFNNDGQMLTGWQKISGTWYYLKDSGAMATGWVKVGSTWYYMNPSGAMVTGWQKISGTWYYFKASGAMAANEWCSGYWLNANGSWTYQPKGSWHKDSTGWWFGDTSGWYAKNTTVKIDNVNYKFNGSGYWVQ